MKKYFFAALFTIFLCIPLFSKQMDPKNLPEMKIRCQGIERSFYLYLPENLPEGAPVVFQLHGYSIKHPRAVDWCKVADEEKFAVCLPCAALDPNGEHGWNVGYNMQKGFKVDDIKFLKVLIRHLNKEYGLSRENVFVTGHSNGGEMCYLLAYEAPDMFRAIAPISGLTMKWMYDELKPKKAVPLLEIHGTEDHTSEWNGALDDEYWGPYISVPIAVGVWVVAARCDHELTSELAPAAPEGHRSIIHRYVSDSNGGIEVQLYEVIGGGHGFSGKDLGCARITWEFFKNYLK